MTKILKPTEENLILASELLKKDEVVAIPTETVYGLGANGLSENAISKIFIAKNRPQDNPLILHISSYKMLEELVEGLNDEIRKFLNNFWPGPLTIIMKKKNIVPDAVSAGLDTVAIRMPSSEIAKKIIEYSKLPIAAPSANISGKPSPTNAQDVFVDMENKISAIVDGGNCKIGIESTVLDLTSKPYTILRPGFYTKDDFLKFEKEINIDIALVADNKTPKSPGQKYKHYAPKAKMIVISTKDREKSKREIEKIYSKNTQQKIGIFKFEETNIEIKNAINLSLGSVENLEEMSKNLFSGLREFDRLKVDLIICEACSEEGIGFSIMNRLKKASSGNILYID